MTTQIELQPSSRSAPVAAFILMLGLICISGCSLSPASDTGRGHLRQVVLRSLDSLTAVFHFDLIEIDETLPFSTPVAPGRGKVCSEDHEFECMIIDGFFVFAIPRTIAADPWPGDHWMFAGQRFEVISASEELYIEQDDWQLLIESKNQMGWFHFNYDAEKGLEYVTLIDKSWPNKEEGDPYKPVLMIVRLEYW